MRRMVRKLFVSFGIPFIYLCLSASIAISADHQQIRLAIVDVGTTQKVPGPFLDLLTTAFTKHSEIALLERDEINKLLKEQALSLSLSSAELVKTGKLWAADAFLMLESSTSGNTSLLHLRLTDARYGYKLWDVSMPFSPKSDEYQTQADLLASLTNRKISNIKLAPENLTMLAVSNFSSEEISKKWNWLSDTLATAIEQNLALYPGVVLMERTKVGTLMDERNLVAGLPEALQASAVLIDGSFKMRQDKGPDTVSVYLRCRKQSKPILETRIEGSTGNLSNLYQKILAVIITSIGKKTDTLAMRPEVEASLLANDARSFLRINDPVQALPLVDAALSLSPNSKEMKQLLLNSSIQVMSRCTDSMEAFWGIPDPKETLDLYLSTAIRISTLIEEEILNNPAQLSPFSNVRRYFNSVYRWFANEMPRYSNGLIGSREKEKLSDLTQISLHLQKLAIASNPEDASLKLLLHNAFVLCNTVDEAINLTRDLLRDNNNRAASISNLVNYLMRPGYDGLPKEKGAADKVVHYLEELTHQDNPLVRVIVEEALVKLYSQYHSDYTEARKHCETAIDLYKKQASSAQDAYPPRIANVITNNRFSADDREDSALKEKYHLDVLEYAFQIGRTQMKTRLDADIVLSITCLVDKYISENRISEAAALIQRGIKEIKSESAESQLQFRLKTWNTKVKGLPDPAPDPVTENRKTKQYQSIKIVSREELKDVARFSNLVVNDRAQAIIYRNPSGQTARLGTIELSPDTFILNAAPRSCPLNFHSNPVRHLYIDYGAEVAADDQDLYFGSDSDGLLILSRNGSCKLMTEENGLSSNIIQSLEVLDGKLYAVIGSLSGLMEVDLKSGTSTVLFSTKSKKQTGDLDGNPIASIAADPNRHALWILSPINGTYNGRFTGNKINRLFIYYPEDRKLDRVNSESINNAFNAFPFREHSIHKFNDNLLIEGLNDSIVIDIQTKIATRLLNDNIDLDPGRHTILSSLKPGESRAKWYIQKLPIRQVLLHHDLIAMHRSQLMYFRDGEKYPEYFEQSFPEKSPVFRDIVLTEKGLLVLTEDALYLIPEIAEQKPGNMLSQKSQP
jgi:hypothetical protein